MLDYGKMLANSQVQAEQDRGIEFLRGVRRLRGELTELYEQVDVRFAAAEQAGGRETLSEAELIAAER